MFEIITKSIFTFLILYAVIDIASKFFEVLFSCEKTKDIFVFIHVKNQEDSIEYIVRCTVLNYLNRYGGRTVPYIVIVDKGSDDDTEIISKKLCSDYDFIYYTTYEKYQKFKNEIKH